MIVPSKTMALLDKLSGDQEAAVSVRFVDNQIAMACHPVVISSSLVEGNFPKYEDIIPKDYEKKLTLETNAVLSAVKRAALLANEDIDTMRGKGVEIGSGDFAENITTEGIDLASLPIGARLHLGEVVLEVTQIGKECHHGCAIRRAVGDCVMPRRGIFTRVIRGGRINRESECYYDL